MSTLPSKPIPFIADLGVIAFGPCSSKLKCPPHKIIDFPAYFYEYENDLGLATPYVGTIDLLNQHAPLGMIPTSTAAGKAMSGYRIPPKGQLQLIIKNPSKTPIKVFLLPYDFSDMPPGHKTFLRQKSYVVGGGGSRNTTAKGVGVKGKTRSLSGPAIPSLGSLPVDIQHKPPLLTRTSTLERLSLQESSPLHPTPDRLRYAVHLQVVSSPHSGRLYVTNSIRVVFSHRSPETDERLRVVLEGPTDPKYTPLERESRLGKGGVKRHKKAKGDLSVASHGKGLNTRDGELLVIGRRSGSAVGRGEAEDDDDEVISSKVHLDLDVAPSGDTSVCFAKPVRTLRTAGVKGKRRGWSTNEAVAAGILPPLPPPSSSPLPGTSESRGTL